MDRGSDGKLQEVGQVSICLQLPSGGFQITKLNGVEIFARFSSSIAPLGDLDQDGFNGKTPVYVHRVNLGRKMDANTAYTH